MSTDKDIIPAVKKSILKSELTKDRFIRKTRKGDNEIYLSLIHI